MRRAAASPKLLASILAVGLLALVAVVALRRERRGRPPRPPVAAWSAATAGDATAPPTAARREVAPRLQLLVPAYFYPSGAGLVAWERLIEAAAQAPLVIVLNPASGPGEEADPNYLAVLRRARRAGARVLGYTPTLYAARPEAEVRADIDRWVGFYPEVAGIFLDQQAADAEHLEYYAGAARYAREKIPAALVVNNPGTVCAEEYFSRPAADAACVFELGEGFARFRLPPWSDLYPPQSFGAMPYGIGTAEAMRDCVRQAARGRIGLIYVTDGEGANPWDRLPGYWEAEVEAVRLVNRRQPP